MKIAIIGSGIAGNVAAYTLRQAHDITVFESGSYVGGHTNTVDVYEDDRSIAVDTGFIVFNDRTYPNFIRLLDEIGQASQPSEMSFSVQADDGKIEYSGSSLNGLFAQRRNIVRPPFYRMIRDILRFNRTTLPSIDRLDDEETLGNYLRKNGYSHEFVNHYLIPMAAAIWSAEPGSVLEMPVRFLVRFFANHGLLQISNRPIWRVIKGGSREYVGKLVDGHRDRIRLNSPVQSIRRIDQRVEVHSATGGTESFDYVFVACHSDQALGLLKDATRTEREVLGAIQYQPNEAILHTDASLMPTKRCAWAAWNYHIPRDSSRHVAVTYNMNILQGLEATKQYLVTLNNDRHIDPDKVIRTVQYEHPVYSRESVAAQRRQAEINTDRTFFCGAYWRSGFHEDGVVSALNALGHFEERLSNGQLHLRRAS
ncbi:MAG: FAD-dependent oxidoreductase [Gammaproteobacteria bacterium]|jgi:predicted NAD/FAD-binding protein|nr:FAD-dependent oxidoreductase [Gammaproteobacteria bacterium]MDH3822044.1 FAD-dependent oxidoreductase [Gammaproteobacteria bacterium]